MSQQKKVDNKKLQKEEIMEKTQELIHLITGSEEYLLYQKQREELIESDGIYQRMNEFKRKNLNLQYSADEDDYYQKMQDLNAEYKDILMDEPLVTRYMITEQSICKLMRKVHDAIALGVDLDTSYME